jgi:hypothetical protein
VNQDVAGSSPVAHLDVLGSGAIGSAAVLEIAGCRFDPYLPSQLKPAHKSGDAPWVRVASSAQSRREAH